MAQAEDGSESEDVGVACPTCGATFGSEHGMKTHHGLVHDESIPELGGEDAEEDMACPTCGETFGSEPGMKIHHVKIHDESLAKVEIECHECGDTKQLYPFFVERAERNYCSKECRIQAGRASGVCHNCGDTFSRKKSKFPDTDRHFCELECRNEFIGGDEHPHAWSNGETGRYSGSWPATADRIRDRDNEICQRCGAERGEQAHPVHHIVPIQRFEDWGETYEFVDVEDSHVGRNLITLCSACHHTVDEDRSECPAPPGSWRTE